MIQANPHINSNNIWDFDFLVYLDMSSLTPTLTILNQTTGAGLANTKYWFVCSIDGVAFHTGSAGTPDKLGVWSTYTIPESIIQVLNEMKWGSSLEVVGYVNDTDTHVTYGPDTRTLPLVRPLGNTAEQENNFGVSKVLAEVRCQDGLLYALDQTFDSYLYQGVAGSVISKTWTLSKPPDPTGTVVSPDVASSTDQQQTFTLAYDGNGFYLLLDTVIDYDLPNGIRARIKYKYKSPCLNVTCRYNICNLQCGIIKLENKVLESGCSASDRETLLLINSVYNRMLTGMMLPACGIDVAALADEIRKMLGATGCGCK